MQLIRSSFLAVAAASALLLAGCAQTPPKEDFKPTVGQAGKDVIWVPTPDAVVQRMLDMAEVKRGDKVVDLGSGDGKITIAAARRGAIARGIEYNPDMVAHARRNAREQGVKVDFEQGDIFVANFRDADVVTLYLLPHLNERLRPILLDMKPGTRVTSHQFTMGDWKPDRTDDLSGRDAHLWIVPAKVAGNWVVNVEGGAPVQLQLQQQYQVLQGTASVGGNRMEIAQAKLRGPAISFSVGDMQFEGMAGHDGRMSGTVRTAAGPRKFTATRSA